MSRPPSERLLAPGTFEPLVADCAAVVRDEIGRRGPVIRTGFNLVRRARPDLVERALRYLLPAFARALDPYHAEAEAAGEALGPHLLARDGDVADSLLAVTDRRIERVENRAVRNLYGKLRGRARAEVVRSLPAVVAVLERHL
ncbi:hypothetical protein PC39_00045 [Salinisphaera sp. PC39]|uniref:DUF6918 family protein n=1 Tax=Salinisphaera sp. PC39 TaxID=1304156 RepID=UPI003341DB2B